MKKTLLIVIVLALVLVAVWMFTREQAQAPAERPDTSSAIQQDVANIDVGDLDKEFQAIDAEINQL